MRGQEATSHFGDLESWLNERRVTEIECLVPDLTGVARGKILPREKFTEDRGMRMPEAIVGMGVTGKYPRGRPVLRRAIHATDRDMLLRPDPTTIAHRAVGDRPDRAGDPRLLSTRRQAWSLSRRARCCAACCELYADKGWKPVVAPELEFYLIERNTDPEHAAAPADRPQRPRRDLAPGLLHRRRQRVRPAVRGHLRLLRADGARTSTR